MCVRSPPSVRPSVLSFCTRSSARLLPRPRASAPCSSHPSVLIRGALRPTRLESDRPAPRVLPTAAGAGRPSSASTATSTSFAPCSPGRRTTTRTRTAPRRRTTRTRSGAPRAGLADPALRPGAGSLARVLRGARPITCVPPRRRAPPAHAVLLRRFCLSTPPSE